MRSSIVMFLKALQISQAFLLYWPFCWLQSLCSHEKLEYIILISSFLEIIRKLLREEVMGVKDMKNLNFRKGWLNPTGNFMMPHGRYGLFNFRINTTYVLVENYLKAYSGINSRPLCPDRLKASLIPYPIT